MSFVKTIFRALSSYWLGLLTLLLLLLLTYLGTVEQIEHGLFATQQKYFNSIWLIHQFKIGSAFAIPIPLPGVYALLIVFTINLVCGAILRFRWSAARVGVLTVHVGILFILLGGLVTFKWSTDGHLTLYEGEQSNEFQSYYEWEVLIAEASGAPGATAQVIPGSSFTDLSGEKTRLFTSASLPFSFSLTHYLVNSQPKPTGASVEELKPNSENEQNVAAIQATVTPKSGTAQQFTLWGMAQQPALFEADGKPWTIQLQRRRWQLPFAISLDKFTRELHPGTNKPASFSSDVTVIEPNTTQKIHISMNKPLRYKGFTMYQASWGPQNARPGDRLFSTLAVVRNPADQFPLYGFIVITVGLLVHFCYRLYLYLRTEAGKQS